MYENNEDFLKIQEVALELEVSEATVRNWMKTGVIEKYQKRKRNLLFEKNEIIGLKRSILDGKNNRLQKRRNKKMISGQTLPSEYTSYKPYLNIVNQIIEISDQFVTSNYVQLILLEISLIFLKDQEKIEIDDFCSQSCLSQKYQRNEIECSSNLRAILNSIIDFNKIDVAKEDFETLIKINELDLEFIRGEDFLGLLYMALSASKDRKNSGSFYTPSKVVDYIINEDSIDYENIDQPKILDPCCGSGNFLIKIFISLEKEFMKKGIRREIYEKEIINEIIYGYDIDQTAVDLSKINLILLTKSQIYSLNPNIECKNTLIEEAPSLFFDSFNHSFNWIIGNPPWGYSFTNDEKKQLNQIYGTNNQSIESFALFIRCGLDLLEENGQLSFVLPESLLNIKIHSSIRQDLLENYNVKKIRKLDRAFSEVFTNSITLTVKKEIVENDNEIKIVTSDNTVILKQSRFLENESYVLNIDSDDKHENILKKIKSNVETFYLLDKQNAEYALGLVTGDNKKYISKEKNGDREVVLKGKDIYKYNFVPGRNYLEFLSNDFQQVAPERFYRAKEKLIYRFINKKLVFAYDNNQTLTLNSANILIPKIEGYDIKYVMAILNSRVAQFYHTYMFSPLKVLKKHIESIPIPKCSKNHHESIVSKIDEIMSSTDNEKRNKLYNEIDIEIMDIYKLVEEERNEIIKSINDNIFLNPESYSKK
ncbi:N-6 DNA methylase [Salisediminibacterium selenitireducens]|uniref:site-specific DNA-methyltransferase (adenine-specific) n=1 Tax=Bacillus selenitireducens (strain ATCC 700615 / DSM 15326 / MLS10) TaxID=439292 RepID=D6XZV1_BACIE|nr:TaqI-like C-terminal specificity domain-containing protein [Salisediminibacterium selenitireducens]ADI00453.1 N-6 DNA methylase [[Bacillus] selenitireducens MLS10]